MTFISEQIIEAQADYLDKSTEHYELAAAELAGAQPHIMAYLFSDSFNVLTDQERGYLLYLALVIWKSIKVEIPEPTLATEEAIGEKEEAIWELMEKSSNKKFRERLDTFFKDSAQEDLLAFIEDSLVYDSEEQDDFMTKPGRELIFVGLKTVVDVLIC